MELRRRFVFRGNAAAFGGRIVRPQDRILEMPGASSLPVTGGRSVARIPGRRFGSFLSFRSAFTLAEGRFTSHRDAVRLSHHTVEEDTLKTATRVRAEVRGLVVGSEKRLTVNRLIAELRSQSPTGRNEPGIPIGDIAIDGMAIDGFPVKVVLDRGLFNEFDTYAALRRATAQRSFGGKYGGRVAVADVKGASIDPPIYGTLVKRLSWVGGRENPRARIEGHSIVVEDFGRIFLGELFVNIGERRLTLMRLELGSHEGGAASGPEVDTNGGWWP